MKITSKKAYGGLILITALWGISFPVMDACLTRMGPFTFVAVRYLVGALILTSLLIKKGKIKKEVIKSGILIGVPFAAAAVLQMIGLKQTSVANASFITGLTVVFVPLVVFLFEKVVPSRATLLGISLSLVGVGIMSKVWSASASIGDLWVLGACVAFSLQIYHLEKYGKGKDAIALTNVVLWTVTLIAAPFAFALESSMVVVIDWKLIAALLFVGVICTAAAIYIQNMLQPYVPSSRAAVIYLLEPVTATAFAWTFGEHILAYQMIGGGIIITGALLIIMAGNREERMKEMVIENDGEIYE